MTEVPHRSAVAFVWGSEEPASCLVDDHPSRQLEQAALRRWGTLADNHVKHGRARLRRNGKARADGKDRQLLNSRDIAALNRAREVLKRLEDAALGRSLGQYDPCAPVAGWDLGRLSEAATAADDAILRVLSVARTYGGVKITDAQLVGRVEARQPVEQVAQPTDATQSVEMDRVPERIEEDPAASLRASGGSTGARNSGRGAGSRAARSG